jgi:hypothetical protein
MDGESNIRYWIAHQHHHCRISPYLLLLPIITTCNTNTATTTTILCCVSYISSRLLYKLGSLFRLAHEQKAIYVLYYVRAQHKLFNYHYYYYFYYFFFLKRWKAGNFKSMMDAIYNGAIVEKTKQYNKQTNNTIYLRILWPVSRLAFEP